MPANLLKRRVARRWCYAGRPDVFGDGQRLPFRDAHFDTAMALDVLEYLPHDRPYEFQQ